MAYDDIAPPGTPYSAPSGWWQNPSHLVGAGTTAAPTSGNLSFVPFDVGPRPMSIQGLGVSVGTAQSGGTVTMTLALYPDDGTGGAPQCSAGPTFSAQVTLTSNGNRQTSGITGTLKPGRYWLASLYVASSAPTTNPTVTMCNSTQDLPYPNTVSIGSTIRGYIIASQSTMPTTDIRLSLTAVASSTVIPCVAVRAA